MLGGVAADLLEPVGRAGADGVGGKADLDAALPEALDLVQVLGHRRLPEALDASTCVRGVQQNEGDVGRVGGFRGGERLHEAEVVELADGGVAGGAHLAVDLLVRCSDPLGILLIREGEHRVAPGPEVAALGAAAERALEGVAVRVDEAGNREPLRHEADAINPECL